MPAVMPPSGMVMMSIKLCMTAAHAMSISLSAPPYLRSMMFTEMSSTLSSAMMSAGERPTCTMRRIQPGLTGCRGMPTAALPPSRKRRIYAVEQIWENTVASAAPRTPMFSTKMKTGSSAILTAAPSMTDRIAVEAKPWLIVI